MGTRVSCAKTAEPIQMPFGGLTYVGPRNHVLDGVTGVEIHPQKETIFGGCPAHRKALESLLW